jgi:hypothetical protein
LQFLSSPWKLWETGRLEDRRAVLKLVFSDHLHYDMKDGFRTAETTLPFKVLASLRHDRGNLVDRKEYEQALTLWRRMLPSLLFIWRSPYTPSVLRAAQLRGYGTGNVRSPLRKLSADQEAELRRSLEPLGV